ncbi:hypothetical protein Syun_025389 [Stephania yunnanensis]|uniref:Uncharacterized protein n=1 Tax=Stephania yunnanensis TaxID=152371 RepID=A0AAP0ES32_9MAGN
MSLGIKIVRLSAEQARFLILLCRGADVDGSGCLVWFGTLSDAREFPEWGQDMFIRVDAIELSKYPIGKLLDGREIGCEEIIEAFRTRGE